MWYRRDYSGGPMGTNDALDMYDAFRDLYDDEMHEHPENAKELAMFQYKFTESGGTQFFHTNCLFHDSFFIRHGCSQHSAPIPTPEFMYGSENFSESLFKK